MNFSQAGILVVAGLMGGFLAGLIGIGGGVIFAPVLFFYLQAIGVSPEYVTSFTLGSSLFCTLLASLSSTYFHMKRKAVVWRLALLTGVFSALAVSLTTRFVTTQPWYDREVFQAVFSIVLILVSLRMFVRQAPQDTGVPVDQLQFHPAIVALTGIVAGMIAAAAGVGGGVIMVPAFNRFLRVPVRQAVATSSATIIFISLAGVLTYMWRGLQIQHGQSLPAIGFVDVGHALLLAIPAIFMARYGVQTAHRIRAAWLRRSFALVALLIALRLLYRAIA